MKSTRLWIYRLLTAWLPETRCYAFKSVLLRWCGAKVGKNVRIVSGVVFSGTGALTIGDDVFIGYGCRISPVAPAEIKIGSHVDFAPQVFVFTGAHAIDPDGEHVAGAGTEASVEIGDGCWLGARSMILPGVEIAPMTVVAAGAVVTKSCLSPRTLIAGVPAKAKKVYE